jgi:hypothetical protein
VIGFVATGRPQQGYHRRRMRSRRPLLGMLLIAGLAACGEQVSQQGKADAESNNSTTAAEARAGATDSPRTGPPHARWNVVDMLRESKGLRYDA